jgi:hypothetical protein
MCVLAEDLGGRERSRLV